MAGRCTARACCAARRRRRSSASSTSATSSVPTPSSACSGTSSGNPTDAHGQESAGGSMLTRILGLVLAIIAGVAAGPAMAQTEPLPLRLGYNVSAPIGTFIGAIGTDAFAREGIKLELQRFQD